MALSMEQLLRRRNGYRTRCRDTVANTNAVVGDEVQHNVATLSSHITILEGIQRSLENLDSQIVSGLDDEAQVEEDIVLNSTERREQQEEDDRQFVRSGAIIVLNGGGGFHGVHARLPKLSLPIFQGDPLQWAAFWDAYESSIHQLLMLSNVDKFNYLRSLLKGVALNSISGIAVTNANYDTAVNLIQQHFVQTQAIINGHVEALVNLPQLTTDDTTKLRSVYDAAEICGLETQNVTSVETGKILTPILLTKLPDDIRLIITRKNDGPIGELDQFRELLRCELQVTELSNISSKQQVVGVRKPERDTVRHSMSTAIALANSSNTHRNNMPSQYCALCRTTDYSVFDCTKFSSLNDRRKQALCNRLCLNCLRVGHIVSKCEAKWRCKQCHRRNHTVLCGAQEGIPSPQQRPSDQRAAVNMAIDHSSDTTRYLNGVSQVLVTTKHAQKNFAQTDMPGALV